MSVRKAIYDLINDVETKAYPLVAPQSVTDPYITFSMHRFPNRTQDGIGPEEVDLTVNIFSSKHADAVTLADAIYAGLEGATGSYDTEDIMICNWESESDDYIEGLDKVVITQEYNLKFN